jgi:probable lipoprotein NlpC
MAVYRKIFFIVFIIIVFFLSIPFIYTNPESPKNLRYHIVNKAKNYIGVPYKWGGKSKKGIDCVGLVNCVLRELIQKKYETIFTYYTEYPKVAKKNMRPGDFVFFRIEGKIAHIGIYVGNNEFIHSPARKQFVRIDKLEGFWGRTFCGARKLYKKESMFIIHSKDKESEKEADND